MHQWLTCWPPACNIRCYQCSLCLLSCCPLCIAVSWNCHSITLFLTGLAVVGIYIYGPESIFSPVTQQLCKLLDSLASSPGTEADKLLFVSSAARRFLCKHRPAGTASNATLPICTFNLAPVAASMSCITCRYAHCTFCQLVILHKSNITGECHVF